MDKNRRYTDAPGLIALFGDDAQQEHVKRTNRAALEALLVLEVVVVIRFIVALLA